MGIPSVYPTGATAYDPEKCWNGYTIFQAKDVGATLIDMNGAVVQQWQGLHGFPNRILPGGYVMGSTGARNPTYGFQDQLDLVQVDWDGNVVWKFDQYEFIEDPGEESQWMARQHHDYQREGNPAGYYTPGMEPTVDKGNTLIVTHKDVNNPKISAMTLLDDVIIEVNWEGEIIWEWICSDHFSEYGFSPDARNAMARNPNKRKLEKDIGDWMHMNSMSVLGPNRWHDAGDERFHPDNIIWDGRMTNIIAIIDKKTGNVVWQVGPDYTAKDPGFKLGWIIGQHHAHMIPRGLPGEGNILVFDNGGWAGYGAPNPGSPIGIHNALRDFSRVLEFDPVTLEIVWQYTPREAGFPQPTDSFRFYSGYISSAQRLPNGNTLITEGAGGRLLEVTSTHEIVWEYVSPYFGQIDNHNMVYRAYRVPYEWIPQLDKPVEKKIEPIDVTQFRVPGADKGDPKRAIKVKESKGFLYQSQTCVEDDEIEEIDKKD